MPNTVLPPPDPVHLVSRRRCQTTASVLFRRGASLFAAVAVASVLVASVLATLVALREPARAEGKPSARELVAGPIEITARRIASFDRAGLAGDRHGTLEFRGGLVLSSPAEGFGGWSGLVLETDGRRLAAVSDAGAWLTAELVYKAGRLEGLTKGRIGPILATDGRRLTRDRDRDAEAIALVSGTLTRGQAIVAFEQNHRIGRFELGADGLSRPASYLKMPAETRQLKRNSGLEAMTVLSAGPQAGSVVAFAERFVDPAGHHTGWIWVRGEPQRLALTDIGGFDVTDLAPLPDGGLVVLERRFRWLEGVRMRLRQIAPRDLRPGTVISGTVLLEADMGSEIDNMEGLAAHRGPRGETILTLISDDNFNALLQRTILLQFALTTPGRAAEAERARR